MKAWASIDLTTKQQNITRLLIMVYKQKSLGALLDISAEQQAAI